MKKLFCTILFIGFISAGVLAQPELDTSFNSTGIQTVSFGISASGVDTAIQPDNKIVAVGSCQPSTYQQCVARYNEDGSLDNTFAQQGFLVNFGIGSGSRVALQSDGKIVVAGSVRVESGFPIYSIRVALARYTSDGVLDSSFGGGNVTFSAGMGLASPRDMIIQPDGKIVIVGESSPWTQFPTATNQGWIARYLPNGTPDTSFGSNGVMNIISTDPVAPQSAVTSVAIQPDGKLLLGIRKRVASNYSYTLQRWNVDGTPDPAWGGGDGSVDVPPDGALQDSIKNLQVMLDGRVVGTISRNIVRFNQDGSLDTSLDGDGIKELWTIAGDPYDLAISASGKITMAGLAPSYMNYWKFAVYKFRSDGSTETGFGNNGLLVLDPVGSGANSNSSSCAFDTQGRIVVGGNATANPNRFTLARLVAPPVMSVDVSGRLTRADGSPVPNAVISTQGGLSATTSPFGYYTLHNVPTNRTYTFSVRARDGSMFDKRTLLPDDNISNFDFVSLPSTDSAGKPQSVPQGAQVKIGPLPGKSR
jgi:uncharacterized delta-60 repeat protein